MSNMQPWSEGQIVLVLVGLIGSGKSTFAKALEMHIPQFRRCNQDDLGNRRAVENLARESLREGLSICIDRTNIDETQRAHWINIAREVRGAEVWCLVFDTPLDICADRLEHRTDHPTIKSFDQARMILHRFASEFRPPAHEEGFDRIMHVKPAEIASPALSFDDILAILSRIQTSPPPSRSHEGYAVSHHGQTNLDRFFGRGRGGRGRGMCSARGVDRSPPSHSSRHRGTPWMASSNRTNIRADEPRSWRRGETENTAASTSGEHASGHQIVRDQIENDEHLRSQQGEDGSEKHAPNDAQAGSNESEQVTEYGTTNNPIVLDLE